MEIKKLEINNVLHELLVEAEKLDAAASASEFTDEENYMRGRAKGIRDAVTRIANDLKVTDADI